MDIDKSADCRNKDVAGEKGEKRPQLWPDGLEGESSAKRICADNASGDALASNELPLEWALGVADMGNEAMDLSTIDQYSSMTGFNLDEGLDWGVVDMVESTVQDDRRNTAPIFVGLSTTSTAMSTSTGYGCEYSSALPMVPTLGLGVLDKNEMVWTREEISTNTSSDLNDVAHGSESSTLTSSFEPFTQTVPEIDVCFGVVIIEVNSSWAGKSGVNTTSVTMTPWNGRMKLTFKDSEAYAGVLTHQVFSQLQKEFNVEYSGKLVALHPPSSASPDKDARSTAKNRRGKSVAELTSSNKCTLRIVVHGCKSQMQQVSKVLSEAGFHFQHPYTTECRWGIEYWNPHYFLRPGGVMPQPMLPPEYKMVQEEGLPQSEPREEVQMAQFMRIFDSAGKPSEAMEIKPSPRLRSNLKPHQLTALTLMIERERGVTEDPKFPSLWRLTTDANKKPRYHHIITGSLEASPPSIHGGILADEMGLGKTLTVLALVCASLDAANSTSPPDTHATLIVTPKSTIAEWKQQLLTHIHPRQILSIIYHGSGRSRKSHSFTEANVVLTTYETLRAEKDKSNSPLLSRTWRRVVLDEAHRICNQSSFIFQSTARLKAMSRWCLTGTPIRNSLTDFFSLISFLQVPRFCERSQFERWIHSPIKRNQPRCFDALRDLIRATCIRRTKESREVSLHLPPKKEVIEQVELDPIDQRLYDFFRDRTAKIAAGLSDQTEQNRGVTDKKGGRNILTLINFLRRICDHGQEMLPLSALQSWKDENNEVDWEMMVHFDDSCEACGESLQVSVVPDKTSSRSKSRKEFECPGCLMRGSTIKNSNKLQITNGLRDTDFVTPSSKLRALLRNLQREQAPINLQTPQGKSVVFSMWTRMLDIAGEALVKHGLSFQRLDGQSTLQQREGAIETFSHDPNCRVMLASIGSAGEGLSLIAGNYVHLLEPHWNPMAETQALNRVHRIGQTREVTIRRYIVKDTIENYVQWIQQDKLRLISRSLDSLEFSQEEIEGERWCQLQEVLKLSKSCDLESKIDRN